MRDGRGGLRLAGEPLPRRGAGRQLGGQHLDRHEPVQRRVEPLEHDAHSPTPDHAADLAGPKGSEARRVVGINGKERVQVVAL